MEIHLLVKKGKTTTDSLVVRRFPTLIGRHRECNLRIAARQVSRRHCVLKLRESQLFICDLESCNGTLVNGVPVRGEQVLRSSDLLEIGPVVFEVSFSPLAMRDADLAAADTIISVHTETELPIPNYPVENAYEVSERLSEIERARPNDTLDTHRPGDNMFTSADSASKIILVDENLDAGVSPTRRLFSSEYSNGPFTKTRDA